MPRQTLAWTYVAGFGVGKSWPSTPPMVVGSRRKPPPCFPDVNMRLGLISTGLADPRSESGVHQLDCQSLGSKKVGEVRVGLTLTTASLSVDPEQGIAFPVAKKTLWELSSTMTPPGAHTLPAPEGVRNTFSELTPSVGTPAT